jgi:hypothetical protein
LPSAISCQCFFWFLPIPFIYFYGYYSWITIPVIK